GDYYFHDWHADRSKATSLLLQKGAHDLDVIHWLAGGYTRRVSGVGELMVYGDITSRRDNSDQRMPDWFDIDVFPPSKQSNLNPVVDVEDISMLQMQLDHGVYASYQQCHFTPDYWRNYTIIGDAGRIENMGDRGGSQIHVWTSRRGGPGRPDRVEVVGYGTGGHAGADPNLVGEFLRFARDGGRTDVSAIAAREAVATGCAGADSVRSGGGMVEVPEVPADLRTYFDGGQAGGGAPSGHVERRGEAGRGLDRHCRVRAVGTRRTAGGFARHPKSGATGGSRSRVPTQPACPRDPHRTHRCGCAGVGRHPGSVDGRAGPPSQRPGPEDRKSTRLNSSHVSIS